MNKLQVLGGGAVVTSTVLFATAGAFAATPHGMPQFGQDAGVPASITAHRHMVQMHGGAGRFMKVRDAIAQALGLTPDQLKTELQTKTLDQLADEHGMTRQQLLTTALKNAGFSDSQIQKIMNAMTKVPHHQAGPLRHQ